MLLQHSQEDLRNFLKIDAVATSQLLRENTKGISNQYPNATEEVLNEINNASPLKCYKHLEFCTHEDQKHLV